MSGNESSLSQGQLENLRESVETEQGPVQEPDEPRPGEQVEDPFGIEDRVTGPGDTATSDPPPAPEPSPPQTGPGGIPTGPQVGTPSPDADRGTEGDVPDATAPDPPDQTTPDRVDFTGEQRQRQEDVAEQISQPQPPETGPGGIPQGPEVGTPTADPEPPDIDAGDIERVDQQTGQVEVTDQFRQEQAAEQFSETVPGEFAASDVVLTGEGPRLDIQGQRQAIAAREGVETEAVTRTPEGFTVERGPPAVDPDTAAAATRIGGTTERQREITEQLPELPTPEEQRQQREQAQQFQRLRLSDDIRGSGQVTDAPSARQMELAEAGPTGAAEMQLSEGAQQVFGGVQEEFVQEPQETLAEPVEAVTGAPGEIERTLGSAAFEVGEASGELATGLQETAIEPSAEVIGAAVEGDIQSQEDILGIFATGPEGEQVIQAEEPPAPTEPIGVGTERFVTGVGTGVTDATVGAPEGIVEVGSLVAEGGEFTSRAIGQKGFREGVETSAQAGGEFAQTVAQQTVQQAQQNPLRFGGTLVGGTVGSAAITPLRFARQDVPTARRTDVDLDVSAQRAAEGVEVDAPTREVVEQTGTTTVRGLRLEAPPIARAAGFRPRGRTLAGTRDFSFTTGAPSLAGQAGELDLSRLGTTGTFTAEAQTPFQADVFRATAETIGDEAGARFTAAETIQQEALRTDRPDFEVESATEAVRQARAVPDEAAPEVADALRETEATVFGSASAAAQVEDFRQPRDVDVVVPDKDEARPVLAEALEGQQATVSDVFDIKEESDVPGRVRGGEQIKFGFTSQAPQELDDIPFNPASEELLRKAGASSFLRQPGTAGTRDIDVGPEPRRAGRTDVREKDVQDTQALARELDIGEENLREFESAFGLERTPSTQTSLFGGTRENLGRLFREERAEVDIGRVGRRTETDTEIEPRRTEVDRQRPRTDIDRSPTARSPSGTTTPTPFPTFGAESPGGQRDTTQQRDQPIPETPAQTGTPGLFGPSPAEPTGPGGEPGFLPSPPEFTGPDTQPFGGPDIDPQGTPFSPDVPFDGFTPSPGFDPGPNPTPNPFTRPEPGPGPGNIPEVTPEDRRPTDRRPRRRGLDDGPDSDDELETFGLGPTGQELQNPVASGAAFIGIGTGRQQDFGSALTPGGELAPTDQEDLENRRGVGLFGEPL